MLKVVIYPATPNLVNKTPFLFHPKEYYRVMVILGFNGKTKIYHTAVKIPYDLGTGSKLEFVHQYSNKFTARSSDFMSRCTSDPFHKQFETFLTEYIRKLVDEHRKGDQLMELHEVEHLGGDRIRRHRKQLKKDLQHWRNVSVNLLGTEKTRAFGRQMALLTQGQLNHYDNYVGQEWSVMVDAGVTVF